MAEPRPQPPSSGLHPLFDRWPAERTILRVFTASLGVTGFNPTASPGRFRPIYAGPPEARAPVPTIYAASDIETALAEGLLRGVDSGGARTRLYATEVRGLAFGSLMPRRDLRLVRLHGAGLKRLRLLRTQLVDSEQEAYAWTAAWAQAIYDQLADADGLVWTSRQNDSARALLLWGGRVATDDLERSSRAWALDREPGLDLVRQACLDAGVDLEA